MPYEVRIAPAAERAIGKLAAPTQRAVLEKLDQLASDPRLAGCEKVKGLGQYDVYRVKVQKDHRVIYQVRDEAIWILVLKVADRREVYRRIDELKRLLRG